MTTPTPREILGVLTMNYTRNPGKECIDAALADLKEAVLSAVGEDDWDKSEHDELRNLKHKVRNEHRAEIRKAILTMFEGE